MDAAQLQRIVDHCQDFLSGHHRSSLSPQQMLTTLAATAGAELKADRYGSGKMISDFEQQIATLLGKDAAVFMPSGTMCQQIALRIWSERKNTRNVAFHPKSHLEIHEHKAYQALHGLHGVLVGAPNRLITCDDLQAVREPLAAILLELPQREIGGQLPSWEQLTAIVAWARERNIATHLDGARLWECAPFYNRPYAEIAALFDTVYVSFYKVLGGIAGAMLAGPEEIIAEARIWQRRHGGNLIHLYPYVLSAQHGLVTRLDRMIAYRDKAVEIARVLTTFAEIEVVPHPPNTNMMHVYLRGDRERLEAAVLQIAQEHRTMLFYPLMPTPLPNYHRFEMWVGDASLDLPTQRIHDLFAELLTRAKA
jgi:threonine aldolase